jgi:hypothetical protein
MTTTLEIGEIKYKAWNALDETTKKNKISPCDLK